MGPPPTRPAWTESSGPVYSENRQMPPSPGMRPFDSRGSPPNPGWPMPYPQHLAGQPRGGHPPAATQLDVWGMGFGKNFSYGMDDHTTYV